MSVLAWNFLPERVWIAERNAALNSHRVPTEPTLLLL